MPSKPQAGARGLQGIGGLPAAMCEVRSWREITPVGNLRQLEIYSMRQRQRRHVKYDGGMSHRTAFNRDRRHHFIKQWRKYRGYTQGQLAEMIGTSVPNLSRIETFQQPYTQDFLEAAADALSTDAASLIMRDPLQSDAIWSLWDHATPGQRTQIVEIAKALMKTGT
jgi:hypothetical protein